MLFCSKITLACSAQKSRWIAGLRWEKSIKIGKRCFVSRPWRSWFALTFCLCMCWIITNHVPLFCAWFLPMLVISKYFNWIVLFYIWCQQSTFITLRHTLVSQLHITTNHILAIQNRNTRFHENLKLAHSTWREQRSHLKKTEYIFKS